MVGVLALAIVLVTNSSSTGNKSHFHVDRVIIKGIIMIGASTCYNASTKISPLKKMSLN